MKKRTFLLLPALMLLVLTACAGDTVSCNAAPPEQTEQTAPAEEMPATVCAIVDLTAGGTIATDTALETFYTDSIGEYAFGSIKSDYVIVTYSDGSEKPVKEALADGDITLADLDRFDIGYIAKLREPPALTVVRYRQQVEAMRTSYHWEVAGDDGTVCAVIADGIHPLDAADSAPVLPAELSTLSHIDPLGACLRFPLLPDEVSVRCWDESCWGDYQAVDRAVSLPVTADTETGLYCLSLPEGNWLCEVSAQWDRGDTCGGSALYLFRTGKAELTVQHIQQ